MRSAVWLAWGLVACTGVTPTEAPSGEAAPSEATPSEVVPTAPPAEPAPVAAAPGPAPADPAADAPADPAAEPVAMIQVGDGPPQPMLHLTGDQLVPGVHVPPFSTAELREGIPMGARFEYRITRPDYPTVLSTWDVTQHGPEEFTFRVTDAREDGTLFAPPRDESRYWVELRNRSAFPKVDYDKTEVEVRFRGKPTKGWLYESKARAGAPIERTWFSSASPGPPVLFTVHESGRETMRMELLSRTP